MLECLFVGLGGFVGSVIRYLIGLIPTKASSVFPIKTLIINIVGAFLIGIVIALAEKCKIMNPRIILFLKVGVCGGFTTFSTFAYEISYAFDNGNAGIGISYAFLSMILGVSAVFLGMFIIQ